MYQIIPIRLLILGASWLAISAVILLGRGESLPSLLYHAILGSDVILLLLTWQPIWLWLWRTIPGLTAWFPDLNGEYDVEIRHNWPVQKKLLAAAKGGRPFDPFGAGQLPDLEMIRLRAKIDAGFYSVSVKMAPHPDEPQPVIESSRTLATALERKHENQPHRLVYVFEQKNRPDQHRVTDETVFQGAAVLNIESKDANEFSGEYWTNRSWRFGVNSAGAIRFKRRA